MISISSRWVDNGQIDGDFIFSWLFQMCLETSSEIPATNRIQKENTAKTYQITCSFQQTYLKVNFESLDQFVSNPIGFHINGMHF